MQGAKIGASPSIPHVNDLMAECPGSSVPWTAWRVGVRVVVRRRLAEGGYSDVLGELLATGPAGVRVRTRKGDVDVPSAEIAVGKIVPPPPPPRRPRTP